ncbi:MAG: hypothetical protein ACRBN8_05760 [Nannocystales bacterium]
MRKTGLWVLGAFLAACGGDADAGSAGGSTGDEETSSSTSDTASTTTITATGPSTTSTTDPSTGPTDPSSTTTSTGVVEGSSTDETGSSSGGCTLGELDCGCDEGACADGLECDASDVCTAPGVCEDDEWGDISSEDNAHFLGSIDDDDDNGGSVMGVLTGPDDVDWFRYDGEDSSFDSVDPFRTIAASAEVRFCKFAECADGLEDTEFACGEGASATTSPGGRPGCCAEDVIHVPDANCSGTISDDMTVWIRVDQPDAACVQYAFDYHY